MKKARLDRRVVFAFVGVVLFAAVLRIARLHSIPPGLFFDEAANLFDVSSILHGAHPLYFTRNNGREPFFFYWAALFASIWGPTAYSIRLSSAILGVLTVVTTFLCAREMLRAWSSDRRWADWAALAAAFALSITYTHLHYSRIGLRSISLPLFLALSYGLVFRGLRRNSWWALAFAGVAGGLSLYTYIPGRIAPLPLLVIPLALGIPCRSWRPFWQMVFVGAVWILVCLPFGVYTLQHPANVMGHTDAVSILSPSNNKGDPVGAVAHGVVATLGAFSFVGTTNADQNLPGRPILDPLLSLFLGIGLLALLGLAIRYGRAKDSPPARGTFRPSVTAFLMVWILAQSLPSALAVGPPGFIRMTGTLPAIAIVIGFGVGYAYRLLVRLGASQREIRGLHQPGRDFVSLSEAKDPTRRGDGFFASRAQNDPIDQPLHGRARVMQRRRAIAVMVPCAALAVSAGWTIRDYFWLWGPSATAYHWMMGDKVDSATYLNRWAREGRVFLAPLYAQDNTIKFLTRNSTIRSFDLGLSLVVPTNRDQDVRYVFPATEKDAIAKVAGELPVPATTATVKDPTGRFTLLTVIQVAPTALPPVPAKRVATFDGGISLVSASISSRTATPGQKVAITLEWLASRPQPYNYTVFIHLRDAANQTVAQVDRQPTNGSYPTTAWQNGDLIWDHYSLAIPASAKPGHYRLVTGLYRLQTLKRLQVIPAAGQPPTNEVTIGTLEISAR